MLKKSDIQAILDRLPDEFEEAEFADLFAASSPLLELSQEEWAKIDATADHAEKHGGLSIAEVKDRVARCSLT